LTAAFVPVVVATALAHSLSEPWGIFHPELSLFALLSAVFIQIGTNLFNDALDFKKGADTEERVGPRRVTQSGLLSYRAVWLGGLISFAIAAALSAPLILAAGPTIVAIGALSLAAGYLYTGGPYPLAYKGLGDAFVLIFFGWVAVLGMMKVHGAEAGGPAWLAGTQVGLLAVSLIAINNYRDHLGDRKAGKLTLAVRLGPKFARAEIVGALLVPFALGSLWLLAGYPRAAGLPFFALPIAIGVCARVLKTEPGSECNALLGRAALVQLLFGVLLSAGLFLD
jgi:1,4-dihydroxy-2-naphthoate octaprenyltransferase